MAKLSYYVDIGNEYLGKHKCVTGRTPKEVQAKATEQVPRWAQEEERARGRRGGRPRALDENKAKLARRLKGEGEHSVEEICEMLGVGRSTLYRYLGEDGRGRTVGGSD